MSAAEPPYRPFLVEQYEDWSDYPGWIEVEPEDEDNEEPLRFATRDEASAWIDFRLTADIAERMAQWEKQRAIVERQRALHDARLAALEAAGLGPERDKEVILYRPHNLYPKPVADRSRYRVALDGEACPTCGVRGYGNKPRLADSAPSQEVARG